MGLLLVVVTQGRAEAPMLATDERAVPPGASMS